MTADPRWWHPYPRLLGSQPRARDPSLGRAAGLRKQRLIPAGDRAHEMQRSGSELGPGRLIPRLDTDRPPGVQDSAGTTTPPQPPGDRPGSHTRRPASEPLLTWAL